MKASIITIGDELLIGQTIDTNSAWIGHELTNLGFDVWKITTIHDRREEILTALSEAEGKTDVVLITGGLGPTSDDITKNTLCEYFGTRLLINEHVLGMISEMMKRRNFPMNENNRRQAEVPESCIVLDNRTGTAPGMWFEKNNTIFVSMPGVPYEMKHIMTLHVLPELRKRFTTQVIVHRNIMTYGTPEARLAEILTDFEDGLPGRIKLAYLPAAGIIKLRLTATGADRPELEQIIEEQVKKLYVTIPEFIYGENEESLEAAVGRLLKERHATLSTAESCTGGQISSLITSVAGSSAYYRGSVIAYANDIKSSLLAIKEEDILAHGAVSREVVSGMALGARKLFGTDFSVATSGIAGPDGGTETKPAGTLWIAVASAKGVITAHEVFGGDRTMNIRRFSLAALNLLRLQILAS